MHDKLLILLIEDDLDAGQEFKDEVEKQIESQVIVVAPPPDMLDLPRLITKHLPDAVLIDQLLEEHSEASYMGIDAFELLQNGFPSLPLYVLTDTPPGPELKELPTGNLIRKGDFLEHEAFREAFLEEFYEAIQSYRERQIDSQRRIELVRELWTKNGITSEVVNHLAQLHFEADRGIEQVIWMAPANGFEKGVRLLEVNRTTIPSESVLVFPFAPSDYIPFQQLIADVTPKEWKQIESGKLPLPQGWNLKTAQVFQRSPQVLRGK